MFDFTLMMFGPSSACCSTLLITTRHWVVCGSRHPKVYGLSGKLIKPGQLLQQAYYHAGVHAGHLFDMTPLDWILRGLRAGSFKLCPSWVTGKGVAHDPVRLNRYDRILKAPESCSERDLVFVLYGSVDKTGERRACCLQLGDSACVLDPELFDDGSFNPVCRGCATIEDCRSQ